MKLLLKIGCHFDLLRKVSLKEKPQFILSTILYILESCMYKGIAYHKGDKWVDSCEYECECVNDMTGSYECVEK
jgi:hypothetical protein